MYYAHSIIKIDSLLRARGFVSRKNESNDPTPAHLLWMCDQISSMNEWSPAAAAKAGRWIGWIFLAMEQGYRADPKSFWPEWVNETSRLMARRDIKLGLDVSVWLRWIRFIKRR